MALALTVDGIIWSAIIAAAATIVVGLGGAALGHRWGLPGLGREVQQQQASLISTLRDELAELREQRDEDARRIEELEDCQGSLRDMERRLRHAEAELLDLYRQVGKRPLRRAPVREA